MADNPKEPLRRLGLRIKRLRKRRGLSQDKVAERVGNSSKHISEIELGKVNVSMLTIISIASTLSVDVAELLRGISSSGADKTCIMLQEDFDKLEELGRIAGRYKRTRSRRSRSG